MAGYSPRYFIAALFASAQVACLTHTHCDGADCFEHSEGSTAPHHGAHHEDEADHECGQDAGPCCGDEHQDHDVHHHSLDGKNHPKRRFTAPAGDIGIRRCGQHRGSRPYAGGTSSGCRRIPSLREIRADIRRTGPSSLLTSHLISFFSILFERLRARPSVWPGAGTRHMEWK